MWNSPQAADEKIVTQEHPVSHIDLLENFPTHSMAPLNPAFIDYLNNRDKYSVPNELGLMPLIPSPVDLSHLRGTKLFKGMQALALPSRFDLREEGKLSPIRDQGPCGACWAFATMGCLESFLLPHESWDFSENHLKNTHGFDPDHCQGGVGLMPAAYLARWSGPVLESQDPYNPYSGYSPSGLPPQKHIQEILTISYIADHSNIKQAIMQYGGVYSAIYWDPNFFQTANNAYYCNYPGLPNNHAVVIVGWDDNYSRYNFLTRPTADGAFIVRNSWGTSWGEGGYFYISYYDLNVGVDSGVISQIEPVTNYNQVYQYDWLGLMDYFGGTDETEWGANIFTSTSNDRLSAVSFYCPVPDASYEVYVYLNSNAGPCSGTLATSKAGKILLPGYHTVSLPDLVQLQIGQKFSVVYKLQTPGFLYPIGVEYPILGYSSAATANADQSYVSSNGSNWTDIVTIVPNTNVCLKAFTTNTQSTLYATHVASDATWWTRISLLNTGTVSTSVQFIAYNENGQVVETKNISNLAPSNSYSADVSELFSSGALAQGLWVKIVHNSKLNGVLEFGTRDNLSHVTIPLLESGSNEIIYPYVVHTAEWFTGITVVNPQTTTSGITIEAYNEAGDLLGATVTAIPPQGKYVRLMPFIFTELDPLSIRFMRVRSNQALIGFELFGSFVNTGLAGMLGVHPGKLYTKAELNDDAQHIRPDDKSTLDLKTAELYSLIYNSIPYPNYFFTGVTFSNLDSQGATVQTELYHYNGTRLVQYNWPDTIDPLQQITREIWAACGDGSFNENAAYMRASSNSPLMGFELFYYGPGDPNSFLIDGIGCATQGSKISYFPVVKVGADWDIDYIGITNLGDVTNNFTVYAYSNTGSLIWTAPNSIPAHGQFLGYLEAEDSGSIAWIKVECSYPAVTSIFYISADWRRMGAYLGLE